MVVMSGYLLPQHIVTTILSYLSPQELSLCAKINKELHFESRQKELWKPLYLSLPQHFKEGDPKPQAGVENQNGYYKKLYTTFKNKFDWVCESCQKNNSALRYFHWRLPGIEDGYFGNVCKKCSTVSVSGEKMVVSKAMSVYRLKRNDLKYLPASYEVTSGKKSVQKRRSTYYPVAAIEERAFIKWGFDFDIKIRNKDSTEIQASKTSEDQVEENENEEEDEGEEDEKEEEEQVGKKGKEKLKSTKVKSNPPTKQSAKISKPVKNDAAQGSEEKTVKTTKAKEGAKRKREEKEGAPTTTQNTRKSARLQK